MLKQFKLINGKLHECVEQPGTVFIYINPDRADLKDLIEKDKIDEHTLNSALDPDEIGRLEFEPNHIAMIIKRPKNYSTEDNLLFKVTSIGIFLFKRKLILIMPE